MKMFSKVFLLISLSALANSLNFILHPQNEAVHEVSEHFLSVAFDSINIERKFAGFNLSDPYLTKLVSHLSPMIFRVGGTDADKLIFSEEESEYNTTFLADDWLKLYQFTQNANVRLLFDLNSLLRNDNGTWNSENAEKMIKYSSEHQMELDWELGNEPDFYNYIYKTHVDATQLAEDFKNLRNILNQYDIYKSSCLVGNDMFNVSNNNATQQYLGTFLEGAASVLHAVTWHQYYFAAKDATEQLFLSPETFNSLEWKINIVMDIVNKYGKGNKVWLGETSSAYNGGAVNMSDRFIATFLWVDKLGLGAKLGLDVIIRQAIYYNNYALINNDIVPNPDWWVSVLYKKIVGTKVLPMANNVHNNDTLRLYAHCAKGANLGLSSAVVVFGINVVNETAPFTLRGLEIDEVYSYELTGETDLYSENIKLNGEVLKLTANGDLPALEPELLKGTNGHLSLSPYSIRFFVIPNCNATACL